MKKIILTLALIGMVFSGTVNLAKADAETDAQQVYIGKIQSQGVNYSVGNYFQAIADNNAQLTEEFLLAGMSVNLTYMKVPALYFAIASGSDKCVQLLIDYGADVNKARMHWTPLLFAINRKQPAAAQVLVVNGADVDATTIDVSPVNYAMKKKQYDTAKLLINSGAKVDDYTVLKSIKSGDTNLKKAVFRQYKF